MVGQNRVQLLLPVVVASCCLKKNLNVASCCCCFSHSAHWLPTRKKYFTRWPIPLVVCWTGKKKKKKVWQRPPPPPHPRALLVRRKKKGKKNHATHPHVYALWRSALRRWSRSVCSTFVEPYVCIFSSCCLAWPVVQSFFDVLATNTLNVRNKFCICSRWSHLNVLTFSPLTGKCSEGLQAFRFFCSLWSHLIKRFDIFPPVWMLRRSRWCRVA